VAGADPNGSPKNAVLGPIFAGNSGREEFGREYSGGQWLYAYVEAILGAVPVGSGQK